MDPNDYIPRQESSQLHEVRWHLANARPPTPLDDLRRLVEQVVEEYEAMEWLIERLLQLLARHTRPGEDPLVDRLLRAHAGPNAN